MDDLRQWFLTWGSWPHNAYIIYGIYQILTFQFVTVPELQLQVATKYFCV